MTGLTLGTVGLAALVLAAAGAVSPVAAEEAVVVGGITPSVRPAGAPAIRGVHNGVDWYRRALTGVGEPYPRSLSFLDNQGEWYTPFVRPGMIDYYDLRNWHRRR